ncbi:MAG: lactate utilization protein B [Thermodesulfobacteriota bacterium]
MSRPAGFAARSARACADAQLQANLKAAALHFQGNRKKAFAAFPEGEAARDLARDVKDAALSRLPELLRELERNVAALGGTVHWAADAAEACGILAEIAQESEAATAVKGKSMVSEEIALNPALEAAGLEVYETDLAEYIIQLAGEPPSHIIAPAIHKNRRQVGELFAKKLGAGYTEEPEELTRIARDTLRRRFLRADLGVTGANLALADSGTLVLVENEGNIRMSTTAPGTHAAVMGIEKVAPGPAEAAAVLAVLARSATGQKMSSYTSFLAGPRRDGERDGAQSFHLVLLDNGRSRILADPELRQALRCIRCGSCLNVCPVYEKAGGHAWPGPYCGPIGSCITPLLGRRDGGDLPFACTGCGACAEVCPVRIDLPGLHMVLRRKLAEDPDFAAPAQRGGPPLSAAAARLFARAAGSPARVRGAASLARALDPGLALASRLAPGLRAWTRTRKPPRLKTPFSAAWPALARELKDREGA